MALDRTGLDCPTAAILDAAPGQVVRVGPSTATSVELGRAGQTIKLVGNMTPNSVAASKTAGAASIGTCALDTNGTVTVTTTAVTATSIIFVTRTAAGGTAGTLYVALAADITAGTSFIIRAFTAGTTAATLDTSTVAWWIIG